MKESKYLGVLFTSEGTMEQETDQTIRVGEVVLHLLYRTIVTKRELSHKAKLLIYRSVFVLSLPSVVMKDGP